MVVEFVRDQLMKIPAIKKALGGLDMSNQGSEGGVEVNYNTVVKDLQAKRDLVCSMASKEAVAGDYKACVIIGEQASKYFERTSGLCTHGVGSYIETKGDCEEGAGVLGWSDLTYSKDNPLVVELDKGDHQITSSWTDQHGDICPTTLGITRSNITFVGTGKDTTTILGGFFVIPK